MDWDDVSIHDVRMRAAFELASYCGDQGNGLLVVLQRSRNPDEGMKDSPLQVEPGTSKTKLDTLGY